MPQVYLTFINQDDVFINTPLLLEYITNRWKFNPAKSTFAGIVHSDKRPKRSSSEKFYTSVEDWPADVYPTYINGPLSLMTSDMPAKLYQASFTARDLWLSEFMVKILIEIKFS